MAGKRNPHKAETTHIRITKALHRRLVALAARLAHAVETGASRSFDVNAEPINPAGCGLSMDALIGELVAREERHLEAAERSRAARRKRMPGVEGET